jgi:hypothetical protein
VFSNFGLGTFIGETLMVIEDDQNLEVMMDRKLFLSSVLLMRFLSPNLYFLFFSSSLHCYRENYCLCERANFLEGQFFCALSYLQNNTKLFMISHYGNYRLCFMGTAYAKSFSCNWNKHCFNAQSHFHIINSNWTLNFWHLGFKTKQN